MQIPQEIYLGERGECSNPILALDQEIRIDMQFVISAFEMEEFDSKHILVKIGELIAYQQWC